MQIRKLFTCAALAALLALASQAHSHDAPTQAAATALPRFAVASEAFELVGVLDGRQLALWLDRAPDNSPVETAQVQLELGGRKVDVKPRGGGELEATLTEALKPGVVPVTATIVAGGERGVLAGELDLRGKQAPHAHARSWRSYAAWAGLSIAALVVAGWLVARVRRNASRRTPAQLLCVLAALVLIRADAVAHTGSDHTTDRGGGTAANSTGPMRLPDGAVFLPKPAQRQIAVRTAIAAEQALPRAFELTAKVVMDPNAGGKVQPTLAGRIESGPRGLPTTGQAVRRGEVLAYVVPSASQIERSNQAAQLAELKANRALAEKRVERLRQLADTIPRKEIDAAESEVASLKGRIAAVGAGLSARETLVAPVTGVIASSHVVAGQVVDARELVFEIVDPARLRIEALAFDAAVARDIGAAFLMAGEHKVPLTFVGAARALRGQALPLTFRAASSALETLAVGQPVKVVVQTRSTVKGVAVPSAAIVRNPSNQAIVWVKTAPERFSPRTVIAEPLDGSLVSVTSGLTAGERVVVSGATLVNQVR